MAGPVVHYGLAGLLALAVSWFTLACRRRGLVAILIGVLLLEILALPFIFGLYGSFFQPLPALLAVLLAFAFAFAFRIIMGSTRGRLATEMFGDHLSREQLQRLIESDFPFGSDATSHEATVVMCDIGNKHVLAEDRSPDLLATMVDGFVRQATSLFLEAGAYIQSADGEGVVGIFGFPVEDPDHAETAARTSLRLLESFNELQQSAPEVFADTHVHIGISSGSILAARFQSGESREVVPVGEPLELARRFAIANRAYNSRILLGPQMFEIAEQILLVRPIDFLSGSATRERFEVYELLKMAKDAGPDEIARRDAFWNAVVYFREKRWGEAYAEFQKAWGEDGADDGPLQLYLRRLEPLVLNLSDMPPVGDTLASH